MVVWWWCGDDCGGLCLVVMWVTVVGLFGRRGSLWWVCSCYVLLCSLCWFDLKCFLVVGGVTRKLDSGGGGWLRESKRNRD